MPDEEVPSVLADLRELTGDAPGVLWKLAEPGRQLDANVVRLVPHQRVDEHAEPELDVLLIVLAGAGVLRTSAGELPLSEGSLLWLPRTSSRAFAAGDRGLTYLTTHRRRPGMRIGPPPEAGPVG